MAAVPSVLSPWGYDLIKAFEGFRDDLPRPISEARATEIMKGDVAVMEHAAQAITGPVR